MRNSQSLKLFLFGVFWWILVGMGFAQSADTVYVYGPGGPYPPIQEAAHRFSQRYGVAVVVTKGPTDRWLEEAKQRADVIYSGAEFMMQNFVWLLDGRVDESTVKPLYLRPSGILVRKGNPKHIRGFEDLLRPGIRILVVNGAGQLGLWEDMAGRLGSLKTLRAFRKNIVYVAHNSAEAKNQWIHNPNLDAWLIWNIWQVANPDIADFVPVSKEYVIYRDCGVALTYKGEKNPYAKKFYDFLSTPEAAEIFRRWGWITGS